MLLIKNKKYCPHAKCGEGKGEGRPRHPWCIIMVGASLVRIWVGVAPKKSRHYWSLYELKPI